MFDIRLQETCLKTIIVGILLRVIVAVPDSFFQPRQIRISFRFPLCNKLYHNFYLISVIYCDDNRQATRPTWQEISSLERSRCLIFPSSLCHAKCGAFLAYDNSAQAYSTCMVLVLDTNTHLLAYYITDLASNGQTLLHSCLYL